MIWVGWREQRAETLIAAGILVVLAVVLLPSGLDMASVYHHDGIANCLGANTTPVTCGAVLDSFRSQFGSLGNLVAWLTLLPGIVGVLLAAPFVSQLESGAYRLDWTQSVTRSRWIAWKIALPVAAAVVFSVAVVELVTWWRVPLVHLSGRLANTTYDSEGVVPVGYTLFALGLGLAVGVVWRRTVSALIVAFVGYFAARLFVDAWLRQRLVAPASVTWKASTGMPLDVQRGWEIREYPSDRLGHPLVARVSCPGGKGACVFPGKGVGYVHSIYEPASRFWSLQLHELGLFAATAALLIAFAAWWTARRV